MTNLEKALFDYENHFIGICELSKKYKISNAVLRAELEAKGYMLGKGVSPKSVVFIKKAIDEYENILNSGEEPNIYQLSLKYGVSHASIKDGVIRRGLKVIRYPKVIQFDDAIFDSIDTEEKAYWLGFLTADGYICSRDNTVGITLASKDKSHVEKFAKFLGCPENVKFKPNNKTGAYRCEIGNKHLHEILVKYGFTPTKSKDATFLDKSFFKSDDLIHHYIRGYFDGDGSISYGPQRMKSKTVYWKHISVLGTYSFITSLNEYLGTNAKIQSKSGIYTISFGGNVAQNVLEKLYDNCNIYLDRKYELYKLAPRLSESDVEKLRKNGEVCDDNTVVTEESKESSEL